MENEPNVEIFSDDDNTNPDDDQDPNYRAFSGFESMTQDCIEWDESKNLDLRNLTSPSYRCISASGDQETPKTNSSSRNKPRRRRERRSPSDIAESSGKHLSKPATEQEIEVLFHRLNGFSNTADIHVTGNSDNRQQNKVTRRVGFDDTVLSRQSDNTNNASAGSRKRWRRDATVQQECLREKSCSNDGSVDVTNHRNRRSRADRDKVNLDSSDSTRAINNGSPMGESTGGSSDFVDLMDRVKTPSPLDYGGCETKNERLPQHLAVITRAATEHSDELSPLKQPIAPNQDLSLVLDDQAFLRPITSIQLNQLGLSLDKAKPENELLNKKCSALHTVHDKENRFPESCKETRVAAKSLSQSIPLSQSNPYLSTKLKLNPYVSTKLNSKKETPAIILHSNICSVSNDDRRKNLHNDILVRPAALSVANDLVNDDISNDMAQGKASRFNEENKTSDLHDEDEFDDLNLTFEDLKTIDSLVIAASQQPIADDSIPSNNTSSKVDHSVFLEDQSTTKEFKVEQRDAQNRESNFVTSASVVDEDDEFGDIAFLDYVTIENVMDERETKSSLVATSSVVDVSDSRKHGVQYELPRIDAAVKNPRVDSSLSLNLTYLSFSRYKILSVDEDFTTFTKTLVVASWTEDMQKDDRINAKAIHRGDQISDHHDKRHCSTRTGAGVVHLRGEWYHTRVTAGDDVNLCSLTGQFRTDPAALPLILHTCPPHGSSNDDLVLVVHPDHLLTPTYISDTISCTRRAVLKSLLGSNGMSSKAALFGTMRHQLFEETMKEKDFNVPTIHSHVTTIVRKNAEGILSCGASSIEAETEILRFFPQITQFANQFTSFGPSPRNSGAGLENHNRAGHPTCFVAEAVEAVEEPLISPELGLKGNIDMIVRARIGQSSSSHGGTLTTSESMLAVELKTGHNQNTQNAHVAQLALYILMMKSRYGSKTMQSSADLGATESGVLLYMNNGAFKGVHVAPMLSEIKSLIGQRNLLAIEQARATRPRGIILSYERDGDSSIMKASVDTESPPPLPELPDVLADSFSCKKCYANRECMLHLATSIPSTSEPFNIADPAKKSHRELLDHFTGHLSTDDFEYFAKWNRLIDLESDSGSFYIAESWLIDSAKLEASSSRSISSLVFEKAMSSHDAVFEESWYSLIALTRSSTSKLQTPLNSLGFGPGCRVVLSTDSTTNGDQILDAPFTKNAVSRSKKGRMHLVRGVVHSSTDTLLLIRASRDDLARVELTALVSGRMPPNETVLFRVDKDESAAGVGTLRQNLVNLFTGDVPNNSGENPPLLTNKNRHIWLRDVLVRHRIPIFSNSLEMTMFSPPPHAADLVPPGCDLFDLALEFLELNADQRAAITKVITAGDFTLIQGMPGTGKTTTIAFVARLLAAHGKRVLITSYTHGAVDTVLLKLIERGLTCTSKNKASSSLIRIGLKSSCHPGVQPCLVSNLAASIEAQHRPASSNQTSEPSAEALRKVVSNARIVGVTALSVPRSPLLLGEHFDVVIVDEAGQITQPAVIGPLMAADSFVLVGDHMQLPPLVVSEAASSGGFAVSLLKALADKHPASVAQLTLQYRMNEDICQLSNDLAYDGKLKCANNHVAARRLEIDGFPSKLSYPSQLKATSWLTQTLDPSCAVMFVDTDIISVSQVGNTEFIPLEHTADSRVGGSIINKTEALLASKFVSELVECGVCPSSIGIICPFRAQLRIIEECNSITESKRLGLEISTIDRYQGRDKDVIILSFVRSNAKGKVGRLLLDFRRLNVAVSRAKCKLIMIGSYSTLYKGSDVLRPILDRVTSNNWIVKLPKDAMDLC